MLESLLFIFLICLGVLFLIISLIILLIGLFKKSTKLKKVAIGIGIIPIFCFGLIAFWYAVAVPSYNNSQMDDFAGVYIPHKSTTELLKQNGIKNDTIKLILNSDGTYEFIKTKGIGLDKSGIWKTGGIDGMFEFGGQHSTEFASPSGSGKESALSFDFMIGENDWRHSESVLFVKE